MKTVLFVVLVFYIYPALAQQNSYTVRPEGDLNKILADSIRFHYPQFTQGTVFFRDGTTSGGVLNYNMVNSEMEFIAPKGDTLSLDNEATIKYIEIGNDTFFYDKIYLQLVEGNATAKLAKKEELKTSDIRKEGGYGGFSSTAAITTYSTLSSNGQATNLTQQQEIKVFKTTTYYLGDANNHFLPMNKKNAVKLFSKKQNAIEQYFKDTKISSNKEEDIAALIAFLNK